MVKLGERERDKHRGGGSVRPHRDGIRVRAVGWITSTSPSQVVRCREMRKAGSSEKYLQRQSFTAKGSEVCRLPGCCGRWAHS